MVQTCAKCLPMSSPPFPLFFSEKSPWPYRGGSFRMQWCDVTKDHGDHGDAFCKALKSKLRVCFSSFSSWHCVCRGDRRLMSFIDTHTRTHTDDVNDMYKVLYLYNLFILYRIVHIRSPSTTRCHDQGPCSSIQNLDKPL